MFRFKPKFILSCVLVGLVAGPVGALASTAAKLNETPPSRKVRYSDLDLNRDAGVAALYTRIRVAAREVCEPMDDVIASLLRARFDCRHDAIARAVADVNSPHLTSYFLEKTNLSNDR
jgi:UrcA family protein